MYGRHIRSMEEAVKEKAGGVSVAEIRIFSVPENLPEAEDNHCLRDKREGKHLQKESGYDQLRFHQGVEYPL
jgi:hypothetical protein